MKIKQAAAGAEQIKKMKLTTKQLRRIIKEEIRLVSEVEDPNSPLPVSGDIGDALSMLRNERDPNGTLQDGTLQNVINRLETALEKLCGEQR